MFRNRNNSQKPTDDLYVSFKQNFPGVGSGTATSSAATSQSSTALSDALNDKAMNNRHFGEPEVAKDQDRTPRGTNDSWRFTPSLLDTNSFAFNSFVNQPPGYYTPTPGGMNTLYHSQAGDLHTPGMTLHLGTPLSMALSGDPLHAGASMDMHGFHPHMFQTNPFQQHGQYMQTQSYAPSSFVHQDSGYEAMEGSPGHNMDLDTEMQRDLHSANFQTHGMDATMAAPPIPSAEKFRYHVTLNAPTAMIRHTDEIPVTYLNKGQAYSVSIVDSVPLAPTPAPVKYRTFVRISFEDEQQRQKPAACWQLWKEGRGLAEAHQRGGKLQAVEYVDPNQQGGEEDVRRPRVELESASFDSFSVIWTPAPTTTSATCSVAVRFNFLSTDFSHSKGVKGVPVRLCAKTEMISSGTPESPPQVPPEVCFCKVKLFRDHGAERKLSNDVAHVKKTIEKLKQQITQVESGVKDFGKRKRTGSVAGKSMGERPGKVQKHKRTWSMSSQNSGGRPTVEEDLHVKLAAVQDMFTSTRPVSVLYLKGTEEDDPDLYPVYLPGQPQDLTKIEAITRQDSWDRRRSTDDTTPTTSCIVSPSPSSRSIPSQPRSNEKASLQRVQSFSVPQQITSEWTASTNFTGLHDTSMIFNTSSLISSVVKVPKGSSDNGLPGWIDALGVDQTYKPPPDLLVKPAACFYVLIKVCGVPPKDDYYRAVYLMERTVKDLVRSIAAKCEVDPIRVERTIRVNSKGLKIIVDEEVVQELPEGQDMSVEFNEIESEVPVKEEKKTSSSPQLSPQPTAAQASARALEMKLLF